MSDYTRYPSTSIEIQHKQNLKDLRAKNKNKKIRDLGWAIIVSNKSTALVTHYSDEDGRISEYGFVL